MTPQPTRFLPEKQILQAFDSLSDLNDQQRKEASELLLDRLAQHEPEEKTMFPELKYSINRLVRGLGSSREMSRQGFSLALINVLKRFTYIKNTDLYKLKTKHLKPNSTLFSITAPAWLGVIFFYNVLLLTGRLEEEHYLVKAARELISLMKKKEYMYQPVLSTLYQILLKVNFETFEQKIYPLLDYVLSCEDIRPYVTKLVVYFAYPSEAFNIFPDIKPQSLYSKEGISTLAKAIYGLTHFYDNHFANIGFKLFATQLYQLNNKDYYKEFSNLIEFGLPELRVKEVVTARTRRRMNIALAILYELLHQIRPEHLETIMTPYICSQLGNLSLCSGKDMDQVHSLMVNELLTFAGKSTEHKNALFKALNNEEIKAEYQEGFKNIYKMELVEQDLESIDEIFKGNFVQELEKHKLRFRDITAEQALKIIKLIVGTLGYRSTTDSPQKHMDVKILPSLTEDQEKDLHKLADEYQYFLGKNESYVRDIVTFCQDVEQNPNISIHILSDREQWARKQIFKVFSQMQKEESTFEKKPTNIKKQHRCFMYFICALLVFQILDKLNIANIVEDIVLSYSLLFESDEIELDPFEGSDESEEELEMLEDRQQNGNIEEEDDEDDEDDEKQGEESEDLADSEEEDEDGEEEDEDEEMSGEEEEEKKTKNNDEDEQSNEEEKEKVVGEVSGVYLLIDVMMRLVVEYGDIMMPFAKLILRKFHHDIDKKSLQLITDIAFMTDSGKAAIETEDTEGVSVLSKIPMKDMAPPNIMPSPDVESEEFEDMDQLTDEQIEQLDTSLGQIFKIRQQALNLEKQRQRVIQKAQKRGITLLIHLVQAKRLNPVTLTLLWPMVRTIFRQEGNKTKNTHLKADLITVCMKLCSNHHVPQGIDIEDATTTVDRVFKLFCRSLSTKLLKVCQTVIIFLIKAISAHTWPYQPLIDVIEKRFKNLSHPKDPDRSKFVKALINTNLELLLPMLQIVSQTANANDNRSMDRLLILDVLIAATKTIKEKNVDLLNRIIEVLSTTLPPLKNQLGSKKPLLKRVVQIATGLRITIKKQFTTKELENDHAGIDTAKLKKALEEAAEGFNGVHVGTIHREIQCLESDTLQPPPKRSNQKTKKSKNKEINHQETASSSASAKKPDLTASKPQQSNLQNEASTPNSAKVGQKRKHEKSEIGLSPAMKKRRLN